MADRWAVLRNGRIESVIMWDGEADYDPGEGATLVLEAEAIAQGITTAPSAPTEDAPIPVQVAPTALADVQDQLAKASSVAEIAAAVGSLVDAFSGG